MIFKVNLFVISCLSIFIPALAQSQEPPCMNLPVGYADIKNGLLTDDKGTMATIDLNLFMKKQVIAGELMDLKSQIKFKTKSLLPIFPVARTPGFERILMRKILPPQNELYLLDQQGEILEHLKLPAFPNDSGLSDHYKFQISEDWQKIFLSSPKNIMTYDLKAKTWKVIYQAGSGVQGLVWTENSSGSMEYAFFYRDRVVFQAPQAVPVSYMNSGTRYFWVYSLETGQKILETSTSSFKGTLFKDHQLIFSEDQRIRLWDFVSGESLEINSPDNLNSYYNTYFEGPLGSLGVGFGQAGKIYLFNEKGQIQNEFQVEPFSSLSIIGRGRRMVLKSTDNSKSVIFDTRTGKQFPWPSFWEDARSGSDRFLDKNQLYFNIYQTLNNSNYLGTVDLTTQCLTPTQVQEYLEKSPWVGNKLSILYLLALESRLPGVDHTKILNKLWHPDLAMEFIKVYLSLVTMTVERDSQFANAWRSYLKFFSPILQPLSSAEKESLINSLSSQMAEKIRSTNEFRDLSTSKLANVIIESMKPYFGVESAGRSDFAFRQQNDKVEPFILSSHPIDDQNAETSQVYGFYSKKLPEFTITKDHYSNYEYQWQQQGKTWRAHGQIRQVNLEQIINRADSINYQNLWRDGKLVGAMIISANLYNGFENLARKMISYFQAEGFSFGIPKVKLSPNEPDLWNSAKNAYLFPWSATTISNGKEWMQKMIESGKLDYWVKEAHSGGADQVVWLAKKNILLKGIRQENGKIEEIYILFPEPQTITNPTNEVPVLDQEYGEWIRRRETQGGKDLVYVNASCWSAQRAKQEIISARSSLLVELPTEESSLTFSNKPNNHERTLIDLIRDGRNYSEMKSTLEKINEVPNPYIFPNEEKYNSSIWSSLSTALDYSVQIESN